MLTMMLNNYITPIKLLRKFLNKSGYCIDMVTIQHIYQQHPLPHSIRALSDTLDTLHIPNMVCRISPAQLEQVPTPAIVFLRESKDLFYIFDGIEKGNKVVLQSTTNTRIIDLKEFYKSWQGDVLLADAKRDRKRTFKLIDAFREIFWFISQSAIWWIAGFFSTIILWNLFFNRSLSLTLYEKAAYIINLLGLVTSTFIIIKTYWNTSLLQNVCISKSIGKCEDIFQANGAFLFGLLPLGVLAWAYFFTMIIWGVFMTRNLLPTWLLYSSLSLGFVIYSIIWQWLQSKVCLWCLILDSLLVLNFTILVHGGNSWIRRLNFYPDVLTWGILYLLVFLSAYKVCALLKATIQRNKLIEKNERLLATNEILPYLLSNSPVILTLDFNKVYAISNGVENFEYCITAIINPACSHCGKAHEMISKVKGCRIDYLMFTSEKDENAILAAKQFITLSLLADDGWEKVNTAMSLWYTKGYVEHSIKEAPNAPDILNAQNRYCYKIGVTATPTILINGCRLPQIYDMNDLEYIL